MKSFHFGNNFIKQDESISDKSIKYYPKDFGKKSVGESVNQFQIEKKYVWMKEELKLPLKIDFEFEFQKPGELVPLWSYNKKEWGKSPDALSISVGTERSDHTFRTKMYGAKPALLDNLEKGFKCDVGKKYKMKIILEQDQAKYYIDDKPIASAFYTEENVC